MSERELRLWAEAELGVGEARRSVKLPDIIRRALRDGSHKRPDDHVAMLDSQLVAGR